MIAARIAQALAGDRKTERNGRGWLTLCCCHDDSSPSLSVADGDTVPLLVHCHAGCDSKQILAELRRRGLLDGTGNAEPSRSPQSRSSHRASQKDDSCWRSIWHEAIDPHGTAVEVYLAGRGLPLPRGRAGECLRFHPHCVFGRNEQGWIYSPATVALVRNIVSNEPQAVHRTALDLHGKKLDELGRNGRLSLGPTKGGAIKLTPDEEVTYGLGVGEGIETVLSLQRLPEWIGSPVWSLLNAGGVGDFPVLAGIETLVVAVDHDERGEEAALAVSERWRAAGREVLLIEAIKPDNDLNNVVPSP